MHLTRCINYDSLLEKMGWQLWSKQDVLLLFNPAMLKLSASAEKGGNLWVQE